jgi:hypothetical protein
VDGVRLGLALKDAEFLKTSGRVQSEVGPSTFVSLGLEYEEEQCVSMLI